jgi:SAM-dependent methyltransferase
VSDPFPRTPEQATALARLYDVDMIDDPGDVDLYLALAARAGSAVLELGVGTGRLAVAIAAAGHDVTGVDNDPQMLARARRRAERVGPAAVERLTLHEADIRGLQLVRRDFGMAFIGLNSLLLLASRDAQREAVRTMAEHVGAGGLAVVDVWQPDADDLARFDGRVILEYPRRDPESGRLVVKVGSAIHDAATQTVVLTTIYEEGDPGTAPIRWLRRDRLRLVSADELAGFAEDAGLDVEVIAGGYDLEPVGPGSERAILVATKG